MSRGLGDVYKRQPSIWNQLPLTKDILTLPSHSNHCSILISSHDWLSYIGLHWLPVESRIHFILASLWFKSLNGSGPRYLSELLLYTPSRQLRSSVDARLFRIPCFRTKCYGQRSFSYRGPSTQNQLPLSRSSFQSFQSSLRTYLFSWFICTFCEHFQMSSSVLPVSS